MSPASEKIGAVVPVPNDQMSIQEGDHQTAAADDLPSKGEVQADQGHIDIALGVLVNETTIDLDPALRRRALRKIDTWVLPLLALTTMLQFLDKSTLNYAAIFGIVEDTGLHGTEYSWLASIFYFGYLVIQPVAAHLLQKLPPAKCLAVTVFVWGFILFMHVVCRNWSGLMAVRFFLGMAEGVVTPAFMLISTAWYARRDQPLRMGVWFSFNGIAGIVGGILAYGLGHIQSSIASWKWMYIVTGALSIFWSVALWFLLPDHQGKAWFLDEHEKRAAVEMVRSNHTGVHNSQFQRSQMVEAFADPKVYILTLMALVWNVPNSIATFGSLVIENFSFTVLGTTLLGMPSGAVEFVLMIIITFVCLRIKSIRIWCMITALTIALVRSIMVFATPYDKKSVLLGGYYLVSLASFVLNKVPLS